MDNVVDLGVLVEKMAVKDGTTVKLHHLRALTRGQAKNVLEADNSQTPLNWNKQTSVEVTPETMFIPSYTSKDIQMLQREDKDLGILHSWLDDKILPSRDEVAQYSPAVREYWLNTENIVRKKGVLYQKRLVYVPQETLNYQLLIPKALRQEIIRNNHDILLSGHFGVNKTSSKIKKKYYWYQMDQDIRLYIRQCKQCNKDKDPRKKPKARLGLYLACYPMDRIAVDIMGPMPLTKGGNRYILVIGDYFTRWMEAYGLPSQHADVVAQKLFMSLSQDLGHL